MQKPGRGFKIFISLLLLGIFFELLAVISILSGDDSRHGNIGIVELQGVLDDPKPVISKLKDFLEADEFKAIVLRVDSPGGPVGSSQEIHDAVVNAVKKKPVVVSMGNIAASGGYYVSAPSSRILADPGTITGSIGVIAHFFVLDDLLKRAHLKWEVIKAGEVKDLGSPLRSLMPKERDLLQKMTDDMHEQFIEAVVRGRKLPLEKVKALADGRVFSGRQALALGLVDELGSLERAIEVAGRLGKVEGKLKPIYPETEKFGWVRRIAEGKVSTPILNVEYRLSP